MSTTQHHQLYNHKIYNHKIYKTYLVNLKRRPDRLEKFLEKYPLPDKQNIVIIEAFDGKTPNENQYETTTYKEIQSTLAEEKAKDNEKKETEAKVKTLIKYIDAKSKLIDAINQVNKKIEKLDK